MLDSPQQIAIASEKGTPRDQGALSLNAMAS
jgi:hypothetical protein